MPGPPCRGRAVAPGFGRITAGRLTLSTGRGASLAAPGADGGSPGSALTLAGSGTSIAGIGLSSLVGWKRIATRVAMVPMTTADTPPITTIEGPRLARALARGGGGSGL